jgi:c-di-GMP-binding flagellar brake protein YcgR
MSGIEKRAHFRQSLLTEAWLGDVGGDGWSPIRLLDISVSGAAFVLKEALGIGTHYMFRFRLPNNPQSVNFIAQIMHCTPHTYLGGYRTGVQISKIDANDLAQIEQFIKNAPQGAA